MAFRPRFPPQNFGFGGGYNRNDYQTNSMNRNGGPSMMRNCNGNIPPMPPLHRFPPGAGSAFSGRPPPFPGSNDPMMRPPPFRNRGPMNGNRMPNMHYPPAYPDPNFFRDGPPRMRFPNAGGHERFFVPWNTRPKPFFGAGKGPAAARNQSRQPLYNQSKSPQKSDDKPKRKKNKKRKFSARPKEDSKKLKPWMTDEIYEEVRKKNEMYVKCKNEDKPELWQEFRLLRNRVSSLIKDAKLKGGFLIRKQKEEDNTERPFSCDTCDRAFVTEGELEAHVKEHIKCGIDNCQFEAQPKVIEIHKKMQHETGYATTIMKLNNDQEIQKWREQRKSQYPTAENIKKRQAEFQEKVERGEIIAPKEFGKIRKRTAVNRATKREWRSRRALPNKERRYKLRIDSGNCSLAPLRKRFKISNSTELDSNSDEEDSHIKLHPFQGMSDHSSIHIPELCSDAALSNTEKTDASQETVSAEFPEAARTLVDGIEPSVCGFTRSEKVISSHPENYPSVDNSDSDDEGPDVLAIQHKREEIALTSLESLNISGTANTTIQERSKERYSLSKSRQQGLRMDMEENNHTSSMPKNSLLEKLLVKEITHERNVILQCIRYTVRNDFFQI